MTHFNNKLPTMEMLASNHYSIERLPFQLHVVMKMKLGKKKRKSMKKLKGVRKVPKERVNFLKFSSFLSLVWFQEKAFTQ